MQDIAVQFEKHCWIHSVSLFPPQVHVGRSPLEFYKEISQIGNINEFELQIENPINNLNRIEISGIFGSGNYNLILITDKQEIDLNNINLFDKYNENISYINLEI
ncbi:hypothetical protein [Spiroplasma endosymbiont of Apeira syringaria]|uniref:hypothetical protein n=1 Tax=Spiroplasma endosymbiont of Apeira syringaria TaxID=3066307 RepID=UPI0030CB8C64